MGEKDPDVVVMAQDSLQSEVELHLVRGSLVNRIRR
jgi:hypothetical protein